MQLEQCVLFGLGKVVDNHFFAHLLRGDFGRPAEFGLGLGGVAEQGFDFSRTEVAGVDFDDGLVVPVAHLIDALPLPAQLQAELGGGPFNELAYAVLHARGNHKVFGLVLLQHHPLHAHIVFGLANIHQGLEDCLYMGNIDALRDWGHAKDYVRMQWMMLQQEQPEDFVIATGVQYSVRQFIEWSAAELGMELRWEGQGVNEVGYWNDKPIVKIDPRYFRPAEVETLLGDPTKAKTKLGWTPEITAQEMCKEMVVNDLAQAKQHALLKLHGYQVNVSVE